MLFHCMNTQQNGLIRRTITCNYSRDLFTMINIFCLCFERGVIMLSRLQYLLNEKAFL